MSLARKTAELAEEKNKIEGIINTMSEGLVSVDREGLITYFNRAAEGLTGLSTGEVLGRNCAVLGKELAQGIHFLLGSPEKQEGIYNEEDKLERRNAPDIPILRNITLLKNGNGKITGAVEAFHNIKELKERDPFKLNGSSVFFNGGMK